MHNIKLFIRFIFTIITIGLITLSIIESSVVPSVTKLISYAILMLIFLMFLVLQIKNPKLIDFLIEAELSENRYESFHLLSSPIIFIGLFIVISKNLDLQFPDLFVYRTKPTSIDWILFGIDQTIRSIGLDFLETFDIHISIIKPYRKSIMWFVFFYKSFLALTFWTLILKFVRVFRKMKTIN